MSYIEKEKLIKTDIASIENRVRHAFNQGYDLGYKEGKANRSEIPTGSPKYCDRSICLKNEYNNVGCEDCEVTKSQESSGDNVVSRDVVKEQMIMYGFHAPDMTVTEFVEDLPPVNPKEPTNKNDLGVDCISRKEVLRLLANNVGKTNTYLQTKVLRMPSVTPQESKTGHWIANAPQYDMLNPQYICSECGNAHTRTTPYCEMCGAKMVEPQESEKA